MQISGLEIVAGLTPPLSRILCLNTKENEIANE